MAILTEDRALQVNNHIITAFDLLTKDANQRILWSSVLLLSPDYLASLRKHAVPLDERALGGLAHSAMALDIYAWLAQRLHRVPPRQPQFVAWTALKSQFGAGLSQMNNFKRKFRTALSQVLALYPAARIEGSTRGLTLYNSSPPIKKRHPVHKSCG